MRVFGLIKNYQVGEREKMECASDRQQAEQTRAELIF